ncbi:hypothetical protein F5876DRAFT_77676 [Lentinula aff. lateritia]|uniref:Uncharacterized protein n=1 Tax=Lentinula aff. lateritia TaxID=2804960 RepID=A0ACC1TXK4_9AGAR|nr:hypothetical protein F5876DRAFT_77676 [Lentinula aff. lateritia]
MSMGHIVIRVNTIVIRNTLHVSSYRREVKDEQISSIDLQLQVWKESPTGIDITQVNKNTSTPHKLMRNLSFWWTFIFYIGRLSIIGGRAADNIMDLLGIYRCLYTVRYVPVAPVQIVFAAGTVYILLAVQATRGLRVAKKDLQIGTTSSGVCRELVESVTEILLKT